MLHLWFKPSDLHAFSQSESYFGASMSNAKEAIQDRSIKIVGRDRHSDLVRIHLAQCAEIPQLKSDSLLDLGILREEKPSFLIDPIKEIMNSQGLVVMIGSKKSSLNSVFKATAFKEDLISVTSIANKIDFNVESSIDWSDLISDSSLDRMSFIAIQRHFNHHDSVSLIKNSVGRILSLGQIKSDIKLAEPIIRESDIISIDLSSVKYSDAPAQINANTVGMFAEEICQLARYIGISEQVKCVEIFGYDPDNDPSHLTAKLIAQIIWYISEGFGLRNPFFSDKFEDLQKHMVDIEIDSNSILFWKNNKSGKWWFQLDQGKDYQKTKMYPCTYEDYREACNSKISDTIVESLSLSLE